MTAMAMEVALASALNTPRALGHRILIQRNKKYPAGHSCILSSSTFYRPSSVSCSFSAPNQEKFEVLHKAMEFAKTSSKNLQNSLPRQVMESQVLHKATEFMKQSSEKLCDSLPRRVKESQVMLKATEYIKAASENLLSTLSPQLCTIMEFIKTSSENLQNTLPTQVKEFPWKKAEDLALQHLLFLGKETARLLLIVFLILSPISDVINAIIRNMELVIPLGLFIGVLAADFFKEVSEELFRAKNEEWDARMHLLGVGLAFAFVKLGLVLLKPPGRILLAHVCNGGLMQIVWLLKRPVETDEQTAMLNGETAFQSSI